jgi:hypothetical protein
MEKINMAYSVENINVNKTYEVNIISATISGNYTVDLSQGNFYRFNLSGDTTLNFENAELTTYNFMVSTGTHSLGLTGSWLTPDGDTLDSSGDFVIATVYDGVSMWAASSFDTIDFDSDALDYIVRVQTADGQSLESGVKIAINDFFKCLKSEGIFDDIKTGCILAGARTLDGAIEPLIGTHSPSYTGFTASSYNRKTGLKGSGTNFIDSDRPGNASPQNDYHKAIYLTEAVANDTQQALLGCGTGLDTGSDQIISDTRNTTTQNGWIMRNRAGTANLFQFASSGGVGARDYVGFVGSSRSVSTEFIGRVDSTNTTLTRDSQSPRATNTILFARGTPASTNLHTDARISFYSLGEATDLAKLETCVQKLMDDLDNVL